MSSPSPVTFSGLASGIDTKSIVSQLMALEQIPRNRLSNQQTVTQARQTELAAIKTKLQAVNDAAKALTSFTTWGVTQGVTSDTDTAVSVSTVGGSAPGSHTVGVTSLATACQVTFDFTAQGGASTLSVNGQSIALAAGATIDDAVGAINGTPTAGVYAVNVAGQIVLTSKTTGAASAVTAAGGGLSGVLATRAGTDAQLTVDGTPYTRASNTITDIVPGLKLTIKRPTTADAVVTVGPPGPDPAVVTAKLQKLVDAYNAATSEIRNAVTTQPLKAADIKTQADLVKGALFGDSGLTGLLSQLRNTVGAVIAGNPAGTQKLADIGVGVPPASAVSSDDALNGVISLDKTKLTDALTTDASAVQRLLGGVTGVAGAAQAFTTVLDPQVQSGGVLDGRTNSVQAEVTALKDRAARMDDKIAAKQAALEKRFAAMESVLAKLQTQSSSMSSFITQMTANNSR